jgi:dipeptidyl aminopeptidase/acylaminoacyl peptidase
LRGYDPAEAAKKVKQPMLILQGERDYQVTMEDYGRWQTALKGQPRVKFISYPTLNHLFVEGRGKSSPAEYQKSLMESEAGDVGIRDIPFQG